MKPLRIESPSAVVAGNLRALVERYGFAVTEAQQDTLRLIHDRDASCLRVMHGGSERLLSCPVAPKTLLDALHASTLHATLRTELGGSWRFTPSVRALSRDDQSCPLTEKETRLMELLLRTYPGSCTRETLLKEIWSYEADIETHTLETHIYRLRQKLEGLEPKPCDITTAEGAYRLVLPL